MSNNYYTYISKNGIKNYFDEYTFEPGLSVPFQCVELMIRDNHPEFFYEYNCAKWILFGYELSDDRIDFESWLYDKRYSEYDSFGLYYS